MIAVIFEVVPAPGRIDLYLDTARDLRPLLDAYRLRIASVVRDYGLNDRNEAPEDSRAFHAA